MTLYIPADNEARVITSYAKATGVATHDAWDNGAGVSDGEDWILFPTAPMDTTTKANIQTEVEDGIAAKLESMGVILEDTTMATLASQTSFTLAAGSDDDDAYNGCLAVITDAATATQRAVGRISDYTGSTKTVTLAEDPAVFTMAATDKVLIIPGTEGLNTALTESYGTDGSPLTVAELLYRINYCRNLHARLCHCSH
jgi:hypothetical protein